MKLKAVVNAKLAKAEHWQRVWHGDGVNGLLDGRDHHGREVRRDAALRGVEEGYGLPLFPIIPHLRNCEVL